MFNNATCIIIKSLCKEQKDLILQKLKSTQLLKLFGIIDSTKNIKELTKEALFKDLYGSKFSPEKEEQLDKDLNLLREILDEELIKSVVDQELKNNTAFKSKMKLFAYRQLNLHQLFEQEYEEAIEIARQQLAYDDIVTIQQWALNIAYQQKFPSLVSYQDKSIFFKKLSEECSTTLADYAVSIHRSIQFFESFSYHYHHQLLGKKADKLPLIFAPTITLKDNTLSLYHYYRTLAIYNEGINSLNYFLEAYKIINNYPYKNETTIELIINTLLNVGRSYQQISNYPHALKYLTIAMEEFLPLLPHYTSIEKLYANYILALLNEYDYLKALKTVEEIQWKFNTPNYIYNWFNIYKVYCFIGLRDTTNVRINLPVINDTISPQHKLYDRLLYCFSLYMENKVEQTIKELDMLNNDSIHSDLNIVTKRIISFFYKEIGRAHV